MPVAVGAEVLNFRSEINSAKHLFEHPPAIGERAELLVAIDDSETSAAIIVAAVGSYQASAATRRPYE